MTKGREHRLKNGHHLCIRRQVAKISGEIVEGISNNYALLFASSVSEQEKQRRKIEDFYKTRSKLAHGEISTIRKDACLEVIYCARESLTAFITDDVLSNLKSMVDLKQYLKQINTPKKESKPLE